MSALPYEQKNRVKERNLKKEVRSYVKRNDPTLVSFPFSFDELNVDTSYLPL